MNVIYEDIIIKSLLRFSVNQDYEKAKLEWMFDGEVIDHGPIHDQIKTANCSLCGHQIRYEYVITNKENKKRLGVGSECIGNYGIVHPSRIEGSLKRLKEAQYKKVSDAYNKASWTVHNLKASIRYKIDEKDGILGFSNPLNKEAKRDYETLNLNNEVIVFKLLTSGIVHQIAQKHNFTLRQDYIDEFMTIFPGAKKDKAGFLKR
jgi:NAD-dependent SIR2 family protein deacetylase